MARNTDPLESLVITITQFHAGDAINVIPPTARLVGTTRSLKTATRDMAERRIRETAQGVAASLGGSANDNEEVYLMKKLLTGGLGALPVENQARL